MQLVEFGNQINEPIVLCLGYFGCMHKGHLELLQKAKERAKENHAKVALFTFSNNHLELLGRESKVVYTFDERISIYRSIGVDFVVSAVFDEAFRDQTGNEFVNKLFKYDLKGIVCGFDYSCGSDRMNCIALREAVKEKCPTDIVDAVCSNGVKVSTTLMRKLLAGNQIDVVNNLLSEPFFLTGVVVPGRHVGRKLGFPTANLSVSKEKFLPLGVFGGEASLDGNKYAAIVNIGQKPTFGLDDVNVEAHLLDFDGDLYGKTVKISLLKYLRPICRFENREQLVSQLMKDREKVLNDQIRSER